MQKFLYLRAPQEALDYLTDYLSPTDFRKHHQKFLYFLDNLYYERIKNKAIQEDDYIRRMSAYVNNLIGKHKLKITGPSNAGDFVRKFWIEAGFVESDNHPIVGKQSMGYKFTDKIKEAPFKSIKITDPILIKHILKFKNQAYEKKLAYLCAAEMNINSLKIKAQEAFDFIEQYNDQPDKYNSYRCMIEDIQNANFHFSRSKTNYRVHSTLTNLPRVLRQFLYLEQETEKLISIDIRNSQPFFFNFLIRSFLKEQGIDENDLPDADEYYRLTSRGKFYEEMATLMGKKLTEENRNEFKEQTFANLFYYEIKPGNPFQITFHRRFSNVYSMLNHYKAIFGNGGLAVEMQKLEAKTWIDQVSRRYYEQDKSAVFFTIHDSLIVQESKLEIVEHIVRTVFEEMGYQITISCKPFISSKERTITNHIISLQKREPYALVTPET